MLRFSLQRSNQLTPKWLGQLCHCCSIAHGSKLLLRDYIQGSLYHPDQGYFSRENMPVGQLDTPLNFHKIMNETEYKLILQRLYQKLQVSWLTPVELFKPFYGHAIAKYLLETHQHTVKASNNNGLNIAEIGGGGGTLAKNVLDYIQEHAPQLYQMTRYTCIEISQTLAERQQEVVVGEGGHHKQFKVVNRNAWEAATWGKPQQQHCFILMTEVLDNLPHDRVERDYAGGDWYQTVVHHTPAQEHTDHANTWIDALEPATDPLIMRCLDAHYGVEGGGSTSAASWWSRVLDVAAGGGAERGERVRFLPTACLALFDILHKLRPHHTLIAADFNELPDVIIPGSCAPLVSSLAGGHSTDYDSLYVPWGSADIFFPTDFPGICRLYQDAADRAERSVGGMSSDSRELRVSHVSSKEFMYRFAEYKAATTLIGYNPLLEDFSNTSILLANSFHRK